MRFHELPVAGAYRIELEPRVDHRGFFARAFSDEELRRHGLPTIYPQSNLSLNHARGTLRGIHYRGDGIEPKLVRCISGAAYHVIVDLRASSPTFLEWTAVRLSRENRTMIFIPGGCGHGLMTLADDTELLYQMGDVYDPDQDRGVRWNDPAFGIEWPMEPVVISDRDQTHPDYTRPDFERVAVAAVS